MLPVCVTCEHEYLWPLKLKKGQIILTRCKNNNNNNQLTHWDVMRALFQLTIRQKYASLRLKMRGDKFEETQVIEFKYK